MHDVPLISPENKDSAESLVEQLPKVSLWEPIRSQASTAEELIADIREQCAQLADDHVVYAELQLNPAAYSFDTSAVVREVAAERFGDLQVRFVIEATEVSAHVGDSADIAGYALPEGHATAAAKFRTNYLPTQIPVGEDFAATESAAQAGVNRLLRPVNLIDDFAADVEGIRPGNASGWIRDRHIPLVFSPLDEVEELTNHPLPLLQQLGFTCCVSSGDSTLSRQFLALSETFGYGLEEFFDLTVKAIENIFDTEETRQRILETVILPAYEDLSDPELAGPDTEDSLEGSGFSMNLNDNASAE
ncbi:amidohydrolase family protein [Corynebacterium macginleyi]|uniref:adenosine deaminase n=1 Tax=Corynebacterium macginleyi TaxID=38290 RepID=UPI001F44B8F4|nr:adenosine deaminase [Corynebacterium macginleyi]